MGRQRSDWSYYGFGGWAERQATDFREAVDLEAVDPLPSAVLAEHLEIPVLPMEELPKLVGSDLPDDLPVSPMEAVRRLSTGKGSPVGACLLRLPERTPLVLVNTSLRPEEQERDAMHEIAHHICRHPYGGLVLTEGGFQKVHDAVQEAEATWLGACLQITREGALYCLEHSLSELEACRRYGLDAVTYRYRLNRSGARKQHSHSLRKLQGDLFAAA